MTRRCAQRQLLLRPSPVTNEVFLYVLAVAAKKFGVQVHAYCVLSNHFHAIVTDPEARLPRFEQYVNSLLARALNASLARWEAFWAPSTYSAVALVEPHDIVEKTAYVLANPVAAGLVRSAREWPGPWSAPELIGGPPLHVSRPAHFFRRNGRMPDEVELALTPPPGFDSADEFRERVVRRLAELEHQAGVEVKSKGRRFLGPGRVLEQDPTHRPARTEPRRTLNPRVAARDKWKRIEALARLVSFNKDYRTAREAFSRGVRDVVFPHGTYLLRVVHGVACAPSG